MIKTFNINLAGQIFNINEDAYEQLLNYFNSLEKFYAMEEGKDEILNDIKSRFAEIFLAKGKNYIITLDDANTAINNMGKPEEFDTNDDVNNDTPNNTTAQETTQTTGKSKRIYRDSDNALVAGVCSGLSYYFGINDPIWMRLIFIVMVFVGFGSPFIIYLILWIIMPEANTVAQKLEMKGEQINLSNIERKVKDEFNKVSDNIGKNSGGILSKIVSFIGKFVLLFIKVILGFGAIMLAIVGGALLLGLLIAAIIIAGLSIFGIPMANRLFFENGSDGWMFGIGTLLICIIPVIFGIAAMVHFLSKNSKPLKKQLIFPLLGLFLFGFLLINISGYHAKQLVSEKRRINQTYALAQPNSMDTLQLIVNPSLLEKNRNEVNININDASDVFDLLSIENENFFPIEIEIYPSLTDSFSIVREYAANGKSTQEALENAGTFTHNIQQKGNKIIIDPYIEFNKEKVKFRNQKLKIKVYVPEGKVIRWDANTENYMDVDKLAINWDHIRNGSMPPMPPMPPLPPNAPKTKIQIQKDSTKIIINVDPSKNIDDELERAQEKLEAAREKLEAARDRIDFEQENIEDSLDAVFERNLGRQHYIFRMINGELVPID